MSDYLVFFVSFCSLSILFVFRYKEKDPTIYQKLPYLLNLSINYLDEQRLFIIFAPKL